MSRSKSIDANDESIPFFYELDRNQQTAILEQSRNIVSKLQASKSRHGLELPLNFESSVLPNNLLNRR
jgi:hypothetical protein